MLVMFFPILVERSSSGVICLRASTLRILIKLCLSPLFLSRSHFRLLSSSSDMGSYFEEGLSCFT